MISITFIQENGVLAKQHVAFTMLYVDMKGLYFFGAIGADAKNINELLFLKEQIKQWTRM